MTASDISALHWLEVAWKWMTRSREGGDENVTDWDAIVLTAASPTQASLYNKQLLFAKQRGLIGNDCTVMAVPDPGGKRIGSGGATFGALKALSLHFMSIGEPQPLSNKRVLLVHAGGDSKRVPWANPMGKAFIPAPLSANIDPDDSVPRLLDHILAIACPLASQMGEAGGLLIMTGDVIPCFNSAAMPLPRHGALVLTVPASLVTASNHGVIVPATQPESLILEECLPAVSALLQKPSAEQMLEQGAVGPTGLALLDTGVFVVMGECWRDLVAFSCGEPDPVVEVMASGEELSLYEELAGAWVPSSHPWLLQRPLGGRLVSCLGSHTLLYYKADELRFLHFGTTMEILDHLSMPASTRPAPALLLSTLLPGAQPWPAASAAAVPAHGSNFVAGSGSVVFDCDFAGGPFSSVAVSLGRCCVLAHVDLSVACAGSSVSDRAAMDLSLCLPDYSCLWQVPLLPQQEQGLPHFLLLFCGVFDNPKAVREKGGTFFGLAWDTWLHTHSCSTAELWHAGQPQSLWTAALFPALPASPEGVRQALAIASWLMRPSCEGADSAAALWRALPRVALSQVHALTNFEALTAGMQTREALVALQAIRDDVQPGRLPGRLSRNLQLLRTRALRCSPSPSSPLLPTASSPHLLNRDAASEACRELATTLWAQLRSQDGSGLVAPGSRVCQAVLDLLGSQDPAASELDDPGSSSSSSSTEWVQEVEQQLWRSVVQETAFSVAQPLALRLPSRSAPLPVLRAGLAVEVRLPVRLDLCGGWSDTPPWSLERVGRVLNLAVTLEGALPVGARASLVEQPPGQEAVLLRDDAGHEETLPLLQPERLLPALPGLLAPSDPFCLLKAALRVLGLPALPLPAGLGLQLETWARVPRGSGLGTSSILAAAVVQALLQLQAGGAGCAVSREAVSCAVLAVEQEMSTGGGWQDQVGGLFPGAKCTVSLPRAPLCLSVCPVPLLARVRSLLEARMLLVFTGQVRLAKNVLKRVVRRYLRRDWSAMRTIDRLASLAETGTSALAAGDLEGLGEVLLEAWGLNCSLEASCTNAQVEALFRGVRHLTVGHKLLGAGGGGFALLLCKSEQAATELRGLIAGMGQPVRLFQWGVYHG